MTRELQKLVGRRALRAEEAGVQATLALRNARAQLADELGREPSRAQTRELTQAWKDELVRLGYDPVTFTRRRSALSRFFSGGLGE